MDNDRRARQHTCINAADVGDVHEAIHDAGDHHADGVHVGGDHHGGAGDLSAERLFFSVPTLFQSMNRGEAALGSSSTSGVHCFLMSSPRGFHPLKGRKQR
jgi:hypothetical protein